MSLTVGAIEKIDIYLDNSETDEPIGSDIVSDIDLRLYTDRSKQIAKYVVDTGIEKIADGQFRLTIPDTDTLKLKDYIGDNGYLEGFLLPCKEPIQIDCGTILDNKAND